MRILVFALGLSIAILSFVVDARAQTGQDAEARALFEAGEVAFGDGRFENALDYFRRSYELSHRPELLFNIGSACDRLRLDADAIVAFEQYLAEIGDAPNRQEVEARLVVLRRSVAATSATTDTTDTTDATETSAIEVSAPGPEPIQPAPPPPARSPSPAPWVILGVGAAAAIAGAVLVGLAVSDVSSVENAARGTTWTSVEAAYGRSEGLSIGGFVLLGVGVAAMGVGLGWGIVDLGSGGETASVAIGPGSVSISGVF